MASRNPRAAGLAQAALDKAGRGGDSVTVAEHGDGVGDHVLDTARAVYDSVFGWTTREDGDGHLVTVSGVDFDTLTVPSALGPGLLFELRQVMGHVGVIADTRVGRWSMLVGLAPSPGLCVPADLVVSRVRPLPRQSPVVLPFPAVERAQGPQWWVVLPSRGSDFVPWQVVVGVARRVVDRGGRR